MTETAGGRVSVVVLSGPTPAGELVNALGESRVDAMVALQLARAQAWATATFPGGSVEVRCGGLAEVIAGAVLTGPDDVLIVASPELATWRADLGPAVLDDLRAGCALSIGPIFDGGLYLLAATGAGVELLRDVGGGGGGGGGGGAAGAIDLTGPAVMARLGALAERAGIEVGLLRTERGLRSAGDVRALLADPLCDGELRTLLHADWGEGT